MLNYNNQFRKPSEGVSSTTVSGLRETKNSQFSSVQEEMGKFNYTLPNTLQRKPSENVAASFNQRPDTVTTQDAQTGLPAQLKHGIEGLSGLAMDDVRVHYNSSQPSQISAHAYAQGNQIHIGPGQEQHLPHEAWHVVQQKQNRVASNMQLKGNIPVNDDKALEHEADVMGEKALKFEHVGASQPLQQQSHSGRGIVQGQWWKLFQNPSLYARDHKFQNMMMMMWHNPMFNRFYNPFMQFMYGRKQVVRGMEPPELYYLMKTGMLRSKAMKNQKNMGIYGKAARDKHLQQSYAPDSQYISTIDAEQFSQQGNHFGSYNVEMVVPNRTFDPESPEPQLLVEGGTTAEILNIYFGGDNKRRLTEAEIKSFMQKFEANKRR